MKKAAKLSKSADALRRYMRASGEGVQSELIRGEPVWTLTVSGLAVRACDVRELKEAGALVPFGIQIDPGADAHCYVLAGTHKKTACGAASISECRGPGLCIDCAPAGVAAEVRANPARADALRFRGSAAP